MILLRLIALFNPCRLFPSLYSSSFSAPNLSCDGMNAAIQARVRLIHILGQHIRETEGKMTGLEIQKKIFALLEIEKHIRVGGE